MAINDDLSKGQSGSTGPGDGTTASRHWLKPQHNADSQRLSDVLRDITRLVSDWVWEVSPDLRFTYMSPRIFETLGFHPAELRDLSLLELGTPVDENGDTVEVDWLRPFRGQLFVARNKLNEERLIELSGVPVFDPETGTFQGVRGTALDTTERRDFEQRLQTAKEEAETANQQKSIFLHRLVDEIQAPLEAISTSTDLIDAARQGGELSDQIRELKVSTRRLEMLTSEIMDLAQLEAGQMDFEIEPIAPTSVVDECILDVQPLAEERNVRILGVHQWDGSIAVDRMRFKQVMLNLITNGIKYNREGGQLTISTSREDPRCYRLSVTDEGRGIPDSYQDDLFQPFSPLRNPDRHDGSGMGLAITKKLVEHMRGRIGLSRLENSGSTFWVEFPAEAKID